MSQRSPVIIMVIATIFVVLFTYTAVSKLVDFEVYEGQMSNQPLPMFINMFLVWAIPAAELMVAFLLLFPKTIKAGLYGSLFLMVLFTGYTGLMYFGYFEKIPCSCGGIIEQLGWGEHLVVNGFLLVIAIVGVAVHLRY